MIEIGLILISLGVVITQYFVYRNMLDEYDKLIKYLIEVKHDVKIDEKGDIEFRKFDSVVLDDEDELLIEQTREQKTDKKPFLEVE
jgi:hypothetical protein